MRRFVLALLCTACSACIGLNPDFGENASEGGSSDAGIVTTQAGTSARGSTSASAETSAGVTGDPDPPGEDTSTSSSTTGTTKGESASDETGPLSTSTGIEPDENRVILFAAGPVTGQFGASGTLAEATAAWCSGAAADLGNGTLCSEGFGLVASGSYSYEAIVGMHPELQTHALVALDGQKVAISFDALSKGEVLGTFANGVLAPLSSPVTPNFWWGPSDQNADDCQLWTYFDGDGRVLRFEPLMSTAVADVSLPCDSLQLLLCGCVPDR
ncbi:MAG: hypothetical protein AAGA54_18175 [Myxococcota bacterium]